MTARTLTIGGGTYPLILPNIRDPRLHVAAVIITIHVLGQVGLGFRSACRSLAAILTARSRGGPDLPADQDVRVARSAMLTGSAWPDPSRRRHAPDDHWTTYAGTYSRPLPALAPVEVR